MASRQPGRNALCWCGSGRKFKRCHLDREHQKTDNPWEAVAANKKAFHSKRCFAKDAGLGPCEGKIIKAHTISRGPSLTKIARNSRVVRYHADPAAMNRNGGKLETSEIGIGDASVFFGFCSGHDRALFSCIENEPFAGRHDQCAAVAYRTLSREYYGKDASAHLRETLRHADKGKNLSEQIEFQHFLTLMAEGISLSKKDLKHTHVALTTALVETRQDALCSMIIEFDGNLPFMLSGAWSPFTDISGELLQDLATDDLLEQVFFSTFGGDGCSHLCISWLNKPEAPGQLIAHQLRQLPPDRLGTACLQFAVKHVENVFFSPDWFETLAHIERAHLDRLVASGIHDFGNLPQEPIDLDLTYKLPDIRRISGS